MAQKADDSTNMSRYHYYTPGCGRGISGLIPGILPNIVHKVKISGRRANPPYLGNKKRKKKVKKLTLTTITYL